MAQTETLKTDINAAMLDSRAQLIGKIYETALRPSEYDALMHDLHDHLSLQVEELVRGRKALNPDTHLQPDAELEEHFDRAFELQEKIGRNETEGSLAPLPQIVITEGEVCLLNREAERRLGAINTVEELKGRMAETSLELFANLMKGGTQHDGERVCLLQIKSNPRDETEPDVILTCTSENDSAGQQRLTMTVLCVEMNGKLAATLSRSYGLSSTELDIIAGLLVGHDLNNIAKAKHRSVHTVRTQLKAIFAKTGISSQMELVRVVTALSRMNLIRKTTDTSELSRGHRRVFSFPGKPLMPVTFEGPENGRPVLFIHGMLDGTAVTKRISALLHQHNIRLIAPIRPNFGDAGINRDHREAPTLFASMLKDLLDELYLDQIHIIGHMAGSVYAFAAAQAMPNRIKGIVNISGGVPIISSSQFSMMSRRQRTVAYTARYAPALLPSILRAGIAQIDSTDRVKFMTALYADGSRDREAVAQTDVGQAILEGYKFAVQQGHAGFQGDSYHVVRDWSPFVLTSNAPVLLLHGAHDPVVHIDSVRAFTQRTGSRIQLCEFRDDGQLLFYAHPEMVMNHLSNFIEAQETTKTRTVA